MHKKPIYSFEDKDDKGIIEVPLLSIVYIERSTGLDSIDDSFNPAGGPALIILLKKDNLDTNSNIANLISNPDHWMWFYNGDIEGRFVKKSGDIMTGQLDIQHADGLHTTGTIKADGVIESKEWIHSLKWMASDEGVRVGTYLTISDKNHSSENNLGAFSYMQDGKWYVNKRSSETNNIEMYLQDDNANYHRVITTKTGVEHWEYAQPTKSGVIKAKLDGNVLRMSTIDSYDP